MELKPNQIESFKKLYKDQFGIELSNSEAYSKAHRLLQYVLLCVKPINSSEGSTIANHLNIYTG
jgi:hypothetical protein